MTVSRQRITPYLSYYCTAGNLKTHKLRGFVAIHESFICEIWGRDVLVAQLAAPASSPQKLSQQKSYFPLFCEFSLHKSFLLYGMTITSKHLHTRKNVDINLREM